MGSGSVVRHPAFGAKVGQCVEPVQLELFNWRQLTQPIFSFLDPQYLDQDKFLDILARNIPSVILDLRLKPIFSQPNYNHREITQYIYNRFNYIELAHLAASEGFCLENFGDQLKGVFSASGQKSLTICLFDNGAMTEGVVSAFRGQMGKVDTRIVEVNPRSLL